MFHSPYNKAFSWAILLHLFLVMMLCMDSSSKNPIVAEALPVQSQTQPAQPEIVKAFSVEDDAVSETVNQLKAERAKQQTMEENRQKAMSRQLEQAKQKRIQEQQKLASLKREADTIAIARKKQAEAEQKQLKALEAQKVKEAQHIKELQKQKEALVKQQAEEVKKLAEINKKNAAEKVKEEAAKKAKAEKALAEKKKSDKVKVDKISADKIRTDKIKVDSSQADALEEAANARIAAQNAAKQAQMAGVVDKYKALIVGAIGKHWIIPDHADTRLSSQFSIKLAPDGSVLHVALLRSSGDPLLDRSAQTAIYKASPLPVPTDAATFNLFREISLTVRPEQVRG